MRDLEGREFARGLVNYQATDARRIVGLRSEQARRVIGPAYYDEVIHRDNLALTR